MKDLKKQKKDLEEQRKDLYESRFELRKRLSNLTANAPYTLLDLETDLIDYLFCIVEGYKDLADLLERQLNEKN